MNGRNKLINKLIEEKGGTKEQYLSLLNKIAYHESAHTMDPTIEQQGGGPGRGKYQFEVGKDRGAITAARRTKRYYESIGEEVPKWLEKASSGDSLDVTKLNSEQQDILFLGNMRMHPKADFSKVWKGEETVQDFWANYHWAGDDSDKDKRLASFNSSLKNYEDKNEGKSRVASTNNQPQTIESNLNFDTSTRVAATQARDNIQQPQPYKITPNLQQPTQMGPQPEEMFNANMGSDLYGFLAARPTKQPTDQKLVAFNEGGSHQQNPYGGVPIGMGSNGKMNTVEEGETMFNDFVFSDKVFTDGTMASNLKGNANTFAFGGNPNNCGGPGQPPCDEDYFETVRNSRQGKRINPDGTESTHVMRREFVPGKGWVAFPSLFQEKDGTWNDLGVEHGDNWEPILEEATKRNEVYTFGKDLEGAIQFADKGIWKKSNQFAAGGPTDPPTDPPTRTYKDSLALYNMGIALSKRDLKDPREYYDAPAEDNPNYYDNTLYRETNDSLYNEMAKLSKRTGIKPYRYFDGTRVTNAKNFNKDITSKSKLPMYPSFKKPTGTIKQRDKISPLNLNLKMEDIFKVPLKTSTPNIIKDAPEVDMWDVERTVRARGAGGGGTTISKETTANAYKMLEQQLRDEKSYAGKYNKLKVKPRKKR